MGMVSQLIKPFCYFYFLIINGHFLKKISVENCPTISRIKRGTYFFVTSVDDLAHSSISQVFNQTLWLVSHYF